MNELEKNTLTKPSSTLTSQPTRAEFPFDEIKRSLKDSLEMDNYDAVIQGMVKQKNNKKIDILKVFLESVYTDINDINSKHTGDDKSFFNINKKILISNLQNSHEILKIYDIGDRKLLYTMLGTLIQYIYERNERE
jgi:c-di-AMP phosphodiesterase-like protein|tara:strand:- start:2127 stop:2534 length:408 start_codon:yes stop_codon:yes gene_type:complete